MAIAQTPPAVPTSRHHIDWQLIGGILTFITACVFVFFLEQERSSIITEKEQQAQQAHDRSIAAAIPADSGRLVDTAFLDESEVVSFIQTLEKTRSSFTGFDLSFTSDKPGGSKPKYLTFEVLLAGPAQNIQAFVGSLLSSTYIIEVQTVELLSEDGFADTATLKLQGNLFIREL